MNLMDRRLGAGEDAPPEHPLIEAARITLLAAGEGRLMKPNYRYYWRAFTPP
jgi:hypothetical protein